MIGDEKTLFPDDQAPLRPERWPGRVQVLPYTNDDLIMASASRSGCRGRHAARRADRSGLGIRNPYNIRIIIEQRPACR